MISFERFFKLRNLLQAFTTRDIQTVSVLLTWAGSNGFSSEEVLQFSQIAPNFTSLERMGYFNKRTTVEQAREIREFERKLPVEFRREARKVRLQNSYSGNVGKD